MLPEDVTAKIKAIEIAASKLVSSQLAGHYHSIFKGSGMTFSEVRPYWAGDDVKNIDWNVSARMNDPYIKLFREERDRQTMLMIDMSGSGLFGTEKRTKLETAAEVAATLAFAVNKNDDKVGLLIFTDHVEKFIPPKKGKKHVLRIVREILTFKPESEQTDLAAGFGYLNKVSKKNTIVFCISDFMADGWQKNLRQLKRHHDFIPIVVQDPIEKEMPAFGWVVLEDLETKENTVLDTFGDISRRMKELADKRDAEREGTFSKMKIDSINIETGTSYVDALIQFFKKRSARRLKK